MGYTAVERAMPRRTLIAGTLSLLFLSGCAKVHLDCSSGLPQTFAIAGSTVGTQAIALGSAAAMMGGGTGGMLGAKEGAAPQQGQGSTLDYSYLAIFGPDSGGLGCGVAQSPTTTINNNSGGVINMPTPTH